MSATNRNKAGHERQHNDFYSTPHWCINRLLDSEPRLHTGGTWLEPCAGKGSIIYAVNSHKCYHKCQQPIWTAIELSTDLSCTHLSNTFYSGIDFLKWNPKCSFDVVISNPPYHLAQSFIEHAMSMSNVVIFLLRLSYLASEKRSNFMRKNTPSIYILPNRPSFVYGQTDNCDYAWFSWGLDENPTIRILNSTSKIERK